MQWGMAPTRATRDGHRPRCGDPHGGSPRRVASRQARHDGRQRWEAPCAEMVAHERTDGGAAAGRMGVRGRVTPNSAEGGRRRREGEEERRSAARRDVVGRAPGLPRGGHRASRQARSGGLTHGRHRAAAGVARAVGAGRVLVRCAGLVMPGRVRAHVRRVHRVARHRGGSAAPPCGVFSRGGVPRVHVTSRSELRRRRLGRRRATVRGTTRARCVGRQQAQRDERARKHGRQSAATRRGHG
jgi:hypothetical protein